MSFRILLKYSAEFYCVKVRPVRNKNTISGVAGTTRPGEKPSFGAGRQRRMLFKYKAIPVSCINGGWGNKKNSSGTKKISRPLDFKKS